ncbi:aminotransferase class III-fold pyridoxal phosphate-dependent enzyme [soil metagenome]
MTAPVTRIEQRYIAANPTSEQMATRARAVCPGGVSQVSRDFKPFPASYDRATGTRKWSVDGAQIVDFVMGHGTLILGHDNPVIRDAIQHQLARGTHFVGPSLPELELAELVCELVPSAERVRFCGTGSEACELALRVARAATRKSVFVKFEGHYHGWHDHELAALRPPFDAAATGGVPASAAANRIVLPPNDLAALERTLSSRTDIACVMLEPGGGTHGTVPTTTAWLEGVRALTRQHGVLLIFDEMVTGFRVAPGGYQALCGVMPDLTTLGKTLFGGLPGAAVAGRADLMDLMRAGSAPFVAHFGTWNAFPVACAAGLACLRLLRDGTVSAHINTYGARLRAAFNDVIARTRVAAHVYGAGSHVHFCLKPWPFGDSDQIPVGRHAELYGDPQRLRLLRLALFNEGLDFDFANNISALHGDEEFTLAIAGFTRAIEAMRVDGLLETSV